MPVRIVLVDDTPEFLFYAARFLSVRPNLEVVGQLVSGEEALNQVPELHPDLVLMDISMPGINGLEATRRLKAQPNSPRVVIMTMFDNAEYRAAAAAAQADDYVVKDRIVEHLLPVIARLFPDGSSESS